LFPFLVCVFLYYSNERLAGRRAPSPATTPPYGVKLYVKVSNCCLYTHDSRAQISCSICNTPIKTQGITIAHFAAVWMRRALFPQSKQRCAPRCENVKNVLHTSVISHGDAECAPLANIISTAAVMLVHSLAGRVISKKVGARTDKSALIQTKAAGSQIAYCVLGQQTAFGF
jgi:hypothetical protein